MYAVMTEDENGARGYPSAERVALQTGDVRSALEPVQVLIQSSAAEWSEDEVVRMFGTSGGVFGEEVEFAFEAPRLSVTAKPWLTHPAEPIRKVRVGLFNDFFFRDHVTDSGTIVRTERLNPIALANAQYAFEDEPMRVSAHGVLREDGRAVVTFVTDPMDAMFLAHRRLRCERAPAAACGGTFVSEVVRDREGVRLRFADFIDLVRMLITMPGDVFVDLSGVALSRDDIRTMSKVFLGAAMDWRLQERGAKVLLTPAQRGLVDLYNETPYDFADRTVMPFVYRCAMHYPIATAPLAFADERPVLHSSNAARGMTVVLFQANKCVTFAEHQQPRCVRERRVGPGGSVSVLDSDRRAVVIASASNAVRWTFEMVASSSFPERAFAEECVVVRVDPAMCHGSATAVTYCEHNAMFLRDSGVDTAVDMLCHAAALSGVSRFLVIVNGDAELLSSLYSAAVKLGAFPRPAEFRCLAAEMPWNPPAALLGKVCDVELGGWEAAMYGPRSVPGHDFPARDALEYHWLRATVSPPVHYASGADGGGSVERAPVEVLTRAEKIACCVRYDGCYWTREGTFHVSVPATAAGRGTGGFETADTVAWESPVYLMWPTGWPARLRVRTANAGHANRMNVINFLQGEYFEDLETRVIAGHLLRAGNTAESTSETSYMTTPEDMSARFPDGVLLPLTIAREDTNRNHPILENFWHVENLDRCTATSYYDESVVAGFAIGVYCSEGSARFRKTTIHTPLLCIRNLYEALYFPEADELEIGDLMLTHYVRPIGGSGCGPGSGSAAGPALSAYDRCKRFIAQTSAFKVSSSGVVFVTRPASACATHTFHEGGAREEEERFVDALFERSTDATDEHFYAKYAQLFGPAVVMESTGARFAVAPGDEIELARVVALHQSASQSSSVRVIAGRPTFAIGTCPLLVMDSKPCYVDRTRHPLFAFTSKTRWGLRVPNGGDLVGRPKRNTAYDVALKGLSVAPPAPVVHRPRAVIERALRDAPRAKLDVTSALHADTYSDYVRVVDSSGRCSIRMAAPGGAFSKCPDEERSLAHMDAVTHRELNGGLYVGSSSAPASNVVTVSAGAPLEDFSGTSDISVAFDVPPHMQWYVDNVCVSDSTNDYIRGITLVSYRHAGALLYPVVNLYEQGHTNPALLILDYNFNVSDRWARHAAGVYRKTVSLPWKGGAWAVTDYRLACGVLARLMSTSSYVRVSVRDFGKESVVLSYCVALAPLFTLGPKRVRIYGAQRSAGLLGWALPRWVRTLSLDGRGRITVRVLESAESWIGNLRADNPDIKWTTDARVASDVILRGNANQVEVAFTAGSRHVEAITSAAIDPETAVLIAIRGRASAVSYRDPTNFPLDVDAGPVWFESVDPRDIPRLLHLARYETKVYHMDRARYDQLLVDAVAARGAPLSDPRPADYVFPETLRYERNSLLRRWPAETGVAAFAQNVLGLTLGSYLSLVDASHEQPPAEGDEIRVIAMRVQTESNHSVYWFESRGGPLSGPAVSVRVASAHGRGVVVRLGRLRRKGTHFEVRRTPAGGATITCAPSPVSILKCVWFFHGLGGEEASFETPAEHEAAVAAGLRLWFFTHSALSGGEPTTFRAVNVVSGRFRYRSRRAAFQKRFSRHFYLGRYDGLASRYSITAAEGALRRWKDARPSSARQSQLTQQQLVGNMKVMYKLSKDALDLDSAYWTSRMQSAHEDSNGDRWVGELSLGGIIPLSDQILASQNLYYTTLV